MTMPGKSFKVKFSVRIWLNNYVLYMIQSSLPDNFDQNLDDEITIKGFLDLHLMTAQDTSGGKEAELLIILQSMGYNNRLILDEVCAYMINYTVPHYKCTCNIY